MPERKAVGPDRRGPDDAWLPATLTDEGTADLLVVTSTVREDTGVESSYRIVGIDETDLDRGWVSWLSPIAKTLLNARLGQRVRFRFPAGEQDLEILKITYE